MKQLAEYENVTQKVSFGNAVFAALMSWREYDVIIQNDDCSRESHMLALVFLNKVRYFMISLRPPPPMSAGHTAL
jgi:hypothetical protein